MNDADQVLSVVARALDQAGIAGGDFAERMLRLVAAYRAYEAEAQRIDHVLFSEGRNRNGDRVDTIVELRARIAELNRELQRRRTSAEDRRRNMAVELGLDEDADGWLEIEKALSAALKARGAEDDLADIDLLLGLPIERPRSPKRREQTRNQIQALVETVNGVLGNEGPPDPLAAPQLLVLAFQLRDVLRGESLRTAPLAARELAQAVEALRTELAAAKVSAQDLPPCDVELTLPEPIPTSVLPQLGVWLERHGGDLFHPSGGKVRLRAFPTKPRN